MTIKNYLEELEIEDSPGVTQQWDHIYMNLDSVQVHR